MALGLENGTYPVAMQMKQPGCVGVPSFQLMKRLHTGVRGTCEQDGVARQARQEGWGGAGVGVDVTCG